MKYSIETLEKEKKILKECLSEWQSNNYPDAKKERQKRLNDLEECIIILKKVKYGVNSFSDNNIYGIYLKTINK